MVICWCCISCCKLCFVIKWLSPPFHLSISFAVYLRHGCGKRMVLFLRVVSRAVMNIIFRGTYRAPRNILLSRVVSCAAIDAWTDMPPMGPGLRDSGCVSLRKTCITIFDISSHGIAHLLLMNLNMCFADLVIVSL